MTIDFKWLKIQENRKTNAYVLVFLVLIQI